MILLALFLFQVKHFVCDFVFQTEYQIQNKSVYGHRAGLTHAGAHFLGSIPALLVLSLSPALIAACLAGEFIVHYHADWLKARFDRQEGADRETHRYWVVFGLDQFVHQLTYVAILGVASFA